MPDFKPGEINNVYLLHKNGTKRPLRNDPASPWCELVWLAVQYQHRKVSPVPWLDAAASSAATEEHGSDSRSRKRRRVGHSSDSNRPVGQGVALR